MSFCRGRVGGVLAVGLVGLIVLLVLMIRFLPSFFRQTDTQEASVSSKEQALMQLEQAVAASTSTNILPELNLAQAYLQRVRETADVKYYESVERVMDQAERKQPNHPEVWATRATVDLGKHEFVRALARGQKALALDPRKAAYQGVIGDAQVELGRYDEAAQAFQRMVDLRPDLSSYSRVAYLRELHGDVDGAIEAYQAAVKAGSAVPENLAWTLVQLGNLFLRSDLERAAQTYRQAQDLLRTPYPPALKGLSRVAMAREDSAEAIRLLEQALNTLPIAEYAIDLGDVYGRTGDEAKAQQYYILARLAFERSAAAGVKTELEQAMFMLERDLDLAQALSLARTAYHDRPSIYGADTLTLALFKNGSLKESEVYFKQALRLGEHDPLILYHASLLAEKQGDKRRGERLQQKAFALHPYFSLRHARSTTK